MLYSGLQRGIVEDNNLLELNPIIVSWKTSKVIPRKYLHDRMISVTCQRTHRKRFYKRKHFDFSFDCLPYH